MDSPIFNPHPYLLQDAEAEQEQLITLPHNFVPRDYQTEHLFRVMFPHRYPDLKLMGVKPKNRICEVWHRRSGKDLSLISAIIIASRERIGNYLYLMPQQNQIRRAIWDGIDNDGVRFLDRIPPQAIEDMRGSDMFIRFTWQSTLQFGGSDTYNSYMSANPVGIVLSEYSLQDPNAWNYLRPILRANKGWAVFLFTFRGKNHGWRLYEIARKDPQTWYSKILTIEDTEKAPGVPVVTRADYEQEIAEGMPEELARQEYYCDPEASLIGSFYGREIDQLYENRRIGNFPHDPAKRVYTGWDIGLDAHAVVFAQEDDAGNPVVIDYIEEVNARFSDVCNMVVAKSYNYAAHFGPHDITKRDSEKEQKILNTAKDLGIDFVKTKRSSRVDGIETVRFLLPRCSIDEIRCERLIEVLKSYRRQWDDVRKCFIEIPVHDWAAHGSDATRILAQNWTPNKIGSNWKKRKIRKRVPKR